MSPLPSPPPDETPELLALRQALSVCRTHGEALQEALQDLHRENLTASRLEHLSKEERRLLDQFAYRYTRLQDDLGARLVPASLRALGEEIAALPMLDRLNRLEQLGWLPSAEEWLEHRRIRNEFAHDYPETAEQRWQRFSLAVASAGQVLQTLEHLASRIGGRFSWLA